MPPLRALYGRLLFGVGARAYDVLTAQQRWRDQITRLLDHHPPSGAERVLDLGTGPGVSAFALASALPPGSSVIGVDLSPQMIARARRHADRLRGLPVAFHVGDARDLPFADASFDRVTGHSFLYLLPDPVAVLREVRRVLTPDGVATFMEPAREGSLIEAAMRAPRPLGALLADPGPTLRFATSMALWRVVSATQTRMDEGRIAALFRAAGFGEARCHPTLNGLGLHCVGRARLSG
jgi:ubiquinone/menaquinone biosynthesis C-methylase UbiE